MPLSSEAASPLCLLVPPCPWASVFSHHYSFFVHTSTPPLPRVLIVEDDTVSGSLLQACIRQANGLPIGPARTADHALDLYATDKPDLVLLDVHLAGQTDGVALASQLRQRNPTIPLLFITGATDDDTYQRAQQLQPVRFVLKPFNPIAVKRIVEAVLLQMTVTAQANAIMNSSKTISLHPPPPPSPASVRRTTCRGTCRLPCR